MRLNRRHERGEAVATGRYTSDLTEGDALGPVGFTQQHADLRAFAQGHGVFVMRWGTTVQRLTRFLQPARRRRLCYGRVSAVIESSIFMQTS